MHTLKLPLKTTEYDEFILDKRYRLINKCHNILVKRVKKLLRRLRRNKAYKSWLEEYRTYKKELDGLLVSIAKLEEVLFDGKGSKVEETLYKKMLQRKEELEALKKGTASKMNAFRETIGLSKAGLESYIKVFQKRHKNHISSHMAQWEADNVYKAAEAVLFSDGKDVHYRKLADMSVIASKSAGNGIRFYDLARNIDYTAKKYEPEHAIGLEYLGLDIPVKMTGKPDLYVIESMDHKISYCMIKREIFDSGWRYYLILVLADAAPEKFTLGKGKMGGDPGTSTFASVGDSFIMLEELAPKCKEYNKKIAKLQAKIDFSKRLSNPDNYNPDGTIKNGKHKWSFSETCKKDQIRLKTLYRKKTAYIKCEHNARANKILQNCDTFICEKMDFPALAKRSTKPAERKPEAQSVKKKDGTVILVHKYKKKRRFGSSVTDRAPAYQCTAIKERMERYGGTYLETDTRSMKASQYDHATGKCQPIPLSQRFKDVDGHPVQRDLYSGFITKNADNALKLPDREACIHGFPVFLKLQESLINQMKDEKISKPQCFGF